MAGNNPTNRRRKKGLFTVVEGSVKKKQVRDPEWIKAQVQTNVLGGDRVRTLLQSRAEMKLSQLDLILCLQRLN